MANAGNKNEAAIARATALVTEALDLLDAHRASPEAAAHLSLAQEQLRQALTESKRLN